MGGLSQDSQSSGYLFLGHLPCLETLEASRAGDVIPVWTPALLLGELPGRAASTSRLHLGCFWGRSQVYLSG